jgi:hypothetical protein
MICTADYELNNKYILQYENVNLLFNKYLNFNINLINCC